jgi:hypothetical protein
MMSRDASVSFFARPDVLPVRGILCGSRSSSGGPDHLVPPKPSSASTGRTGTIATPRTPQLGPISTRAIVIPKNPPNIFKNAYHNHLQPDTPPKLSNRVREIPRWPYIVYSIFNIAHPQHGTSISSVQRSAFSDRGNQGRLSHACPYRSAHPSLSQRHTPALPARRPEIPTHSGRFMQLNPRFCRSYWVRGGTKTTVPITLRCLLPTADQRSAIRNQH